MSEMWSETFSLLEDAQGNHCAFFPFALLQLISSAAHVLHQKVDSPMTATTKDQQVELLRLIDLARLFNPSEWSQSVKLNTPVTSHDQRTIVASAHRAATIIYLYRVLIWLEPSLQPQDKLETLVAEINAQLTLISPELVVFTTTTWPTFIAGAETADPVQRAYAKARLQQLWQVEPWDNKLQALSILESIWDETPSEKGAAKKPSKDWLRIVLESDLEWLIL